MVTSTAHKKLSIKPTAKKTDLLSSEHKQQLRDLGIMNAKDILNIRGLKALKALRHLQQAYLRPYKALKGPYKALKGPYKALKRPYKALKGPYKALRAL